MTTELNHTLEQVQAEERKLRSELFTWATQKPPTPIPNTITTESTKIRFTNAVGDQVTYDELGAELHQRLHTVGSLLQLMKTDAFENAREREHLSQHQSNGDPIADWELELMGARKVANIRYKAVCYTCADKESDTNYFGLVLTWEGETNLEVNDAVQARALHITEDGLHFDHHVKLELV